MLEIFLAGIFIVYILFYVFQCEQFKLLIRNTLCLHRAARAVHHYLTEFQGVLFLPDAVRAGFFNIPSISSSLFLVLFSSIFNCFSISIKKEKYASQYSTKSRHVVNSFLVYIALLFFRVVNSLESVFVKYLFVFVLIFCTTPQAVQLRLRWSSFLQLDGSMDGWMDV